MGDMRQKSQEQLVFPFAEGSEASRSATEGPRRPGRGEKPRTRLAPRNRGSITNGTAVYGSVRTVVWEGWRSDPSPYPDPRTSPLVSGLAARTGGPTWSRQALG